MLSLILAALSLQPAYEPRPWVLMAARQSGPFLVWTQARYRNGRECMEDAMRVASRLPVAAIYCTRDYDQT